MKNCNGVDRIGYPRKINGVSTNTIHACQMCINSKSYMHGTFAILTATSTCFSNLMCVQLNVIQMTLHWVFFQCNVAWSLLLHTMFFLCNVVPIVIWHYWISSRHVQFCLSGASWRLLHAQDFHLCTTVIQKGTKVNYF